MYVIHSMGERLLLEGAQSEDTPLLATAVADHKTGPVIKDDLGEMA
jgi:hypothetical protein